MGFQPLSLRIREQVIAELLVHRSVTTICKICGVSRYTVSKIRHEEGIGVPKKRRLPVRVRRFRCPICHTLNELKAERDDKICMICAMRMREP